MNHIFPTQADSIPGQEYMPWVFRVMHGHLSAKDAAREYKEHKDREIRLAADFDKAKREFEEALRELEEAE